MAGMRGRKGVTPVRARRRQSDAKWRASVASCYDTLRFILGDVKKSAKGKVTKALILQETESRIDTLEKLADSLLQQKAEQIRKGETLMTPNTILSLEELRHQFLLSQKPINSTKRPRRKTLPMPKPVLTRSSYILSNPVTMPIKPGGMTKKESVATGRTKIALPSYINTLVSNVKRSQAQATVNSQQYYCPNHQRMQSPPSPGARACIATRGYSCKQSNNSMPQTVETLEQELDLLSGYKMITRQISPNVCYSAPQKQYYRHTIHPKTGSSVSVLRGGQMTSNQEPPCTIRLSSGTPSVTAASYPDTVQSINDQGPATVGERKQSCNSPAVAFLSNTTYPVKATQRQSSVVQRTNILSRSSSIGEPASVSSVNKTMVPRKVIITPVSDMNDEHAEYTLSFHKCSPNTQQLLSSNKLLASSSYVSVKTEPNDQAAHSGQRSSSFSYETYQPQPPSNELQLASSHLPQIVPQSFSTPKKCSVKMLPGLSPMSTRKAAAAAYQNHPAFLTPSKVLKQLPFSSSPLLMTPSRDSAAGRGFNCTPVKLKSIDSTPATSGYHSNYSSQGIESVSSETLLCTETIDNIEYEDSLGLTVEICTSYNDLEKTPSATYHPQNDTRIYTYHQNAVGNAPEKKRRKLQVTGTSLSQSGRQIIKAEPPDSPESDSKPRCCRKLECFYPEVNEAEDEDDAVVPDSQASNTDDGIPLLNDVRLRSTATSDHADFDGYLYFYQQMSKALEKRLSTDEIRSPRYAVVISQMWNDFTDEERDTLCTIATLENNHLYMENGSQLSEDLADLAVVPLSDEAAFHEEIEFKGILRQKADLFLANNSMLRLSSSADGDDDATVPCLATPSPVSMKEEEHDSQAVPSFFDDHPENISEYLHGNPVDEVEIDNEWSDLPGFVKIESDF